MHQGVGDGDSVARRAPRTHQRQGLPCKPSREGRQEGDAGWSEVEGQPGWPSTREVTHVRQGPDTHHFKGSQHFTSLTDMLDLP